MLPLYVKQCHGTANNLFNSSPYIGDMAEGLTPVANDVRGQREQIVLTLNMTLLHEANLSNKKK
jgi:hypothetical protein